jgi:hypothetical protein
MNQPQEQSRREFFRTAGRFGALLAVIGGVGALQARGDCGQSSCAACPKLDGCKLRQAGQWRNRHERQPS